MSNDHVTRNNDPPQLWWPDKREDIPPEIFNDWPDESSVPDMIAFHQRRGIKVDPAQALKDINTLRQVRYRQWQSDILNRE